MLYTHWKYANLSKRVWFFWIERRIKYYFEWFSAIFICTFCFSNSFNSMEIFCRHLHGQSIDIIMNSPESDTEVNEQLIRRAEKKKLLNHTVGVHFQRVCSLHTRNTNDKVKRHLIIGSSKKFLFIKISSDKHEPSSTQVFGRLLVIQLFSLLALFAMKFHVLFTFSPFNLRQFS